MFTRLAQAASVLCVLLSLELALNVAMSQTALRTSEMPLLARLAAFSVNAMGATLLVAIALTAAAAVRWLSRAFTVVAPAHGVLRVCAVVLTWAIVTLYVASWGMYAVVSRFLDKKGLDFWLVQPIQLFYWVEPYVFASLFAASVILSWVLVAWIPRRVSRSDRSTQRSLVGFACVLALLAGAGALFGELTSAPKPSPFEPDPLYVAVRDQRAGPFAHVLAEIRAPLRAGLLAPSDISIERRPIVPLESYLAGVEPGRRKHWNVVFVVVESLRADQLRAYSSTRDVMPAVDALARESRVYLTSFTTASHSSYSAPVPVSSQYPLRIDGIYDYPADAPYPRVMIYDVLKPLGYRTAIFSSQNEYWQGMLNFLQTPGLDRFFHPAVFEKTKHAGSVDDYDTVEQAIAWIDERDEPFFLALNLQNSHLPYTVPATFRRRFAPVEPQFSINFGMWPRHQADFVKDLYADSLAYVDVQIARLFEHLRARGMWDRTLVVVTGDHGQAFYEHGFSAHASAIYDEVMRVPLVVRAPGLAPALDARPAQILDIAPTALDLLGLPPHPGFQGESLVTPDYDPNRSIYMVAQTPLADQYGIVRGAYKLIYDNHYGQHLLYNVVKDPGEHADVASVRPDLVRELAERLFTWREAQLGYYADPDRYLHEYAPVLAE